MVYTSISEHVEVINSMYAQTEIIEKIISEIVHAFADFKKVLVFGNGGSAVDAEHMVGELVSKFKIDRQGLRAYALTSNNAVLTAIGNDYDYSEVFSRQVNALAEEGDIVIGISTSGTSPNVIKGLDKAKELGAIPILITGDVQSPYRLTLNLKSNNTPRIQEAYLLAIHIICESVEEIIFG